MRLVEMQMKGQIGPSAEKTEEAILRKIRLHLPFRFRTFF